MYFTRNWVWPQNQLSLMKYTTHPKYLASLFWKPEKSVPMGRRQMCSIHSWARSCMFVMISVLTEAWWTQQKSCGIYRKNAINSDTWKICCNHPKIWTRWLYYVIMHSKDANGMADSVDPGAVWSGCPELSFQKFRIITVVFLAGQIWPKFAE